MMKPKINRMIVSRRMARRGLKTRDIDFFLSAWDDMNYQRQSSRWGEIEPLKRERAVKIPLPQSAEYSRLYELGAANIGRCAVVKLNGGRATSMGGKMPKCMITAKEGKNFLEIVLQQIMAANDQLGAEMPLVLMNSFFTDHVTEKIIDKTPLMILNFIQNEFPRIRKDTLLPLDTGTDEDWCPGGHGDFFFSLDSTGMLDILLDLGLRYAFISNIDNLSAVADPVILGKMISDENDFLMEIIQKTEADKKGGSPVEHNGRLSLLEIAEVPEKNLAEFQDINSFIYFNTNNMWVDLQALRRLLDEDHLQLPAIQNRKRIAGTEIVQIETAMGAALGCFGHPDLVEVSRDRFSPVKTMADLKLLQSDAFQMNGNFIITRSENCTEPGRTILMDGYSKKPEQKFPLQKVKYAET